MTVSPLQVRLGGGVEVILVQRETEATAEHDEPVDVVELSPANWLVERYVALQQSKPTPHYTLREASDNTSHRQQQTHSHRTELTANRYECSLTKL